MSWKFYKFPSLAILSLAMLSWSVSCASRSAASSAEARRQQAVRLAESGPQAIPALKKLLQDESNLVRRAAVRSLAEHGQEGREVLHQVLKDNSDDLSRRMAVQILCQGKHPDQCLDILETALTNQPLAVRVFAASALAADLPATGRRLELMQKATQDPDLAVRSLVLRATWPFRNDTILLRNRPDWDYDVVVKERFPLPEKGWKLALDEDVLGHTKGWFKIDFDDRAWTDIAIGKAWEQQGIVYDGYAWYRGTFKAPAKPDKFNAVELHFGGVDECSWVWLNGKYIGDHDLGPDGWDKPFSLDVTKELKWGEENQLTVRVHDSAFAGGIWQPINIEVMQ